MRQISEDAATAFLRDEYFHKDNTTVSTAEDVTTLHLFGNEIAYKYKGEDEIFIKTEGYPTQTTRERLSAILPEHSIRMRKGTLILDEKIEIPSYKWFNVTRYER